MPNPENNISLAALAEISEFNGPTQLGEASVFLQGPYTCIHVRQLTEQFEGTQWAQETRVWVDSKTGNIDKHCTVAGFLTGKRFSPTRELEKALHSAADVLATVRAATQRTS